MNIGFIGLGAMGGGMAKNLLKANVPLTVYDISQSAVASLVEAGATAAASPADLATKIDMLFMCVPYTPQVQATLFEDNGVLAGAKPGLHIIDNTTLNYYDALGIAERVREAGLTYNDCPVSGMPWRADDGTLTMMFGGSDEAFEGAKAHLQMMGSNIIHCGDIGMGQVAKAINNIIYDVNIAAICEVMPLALKAGLRSDKLEELITTGSSRSFASEYFASRILDRKFAGDFSLRSAYKDIVNVQDIANRLQASTPVVNAMVATYQQTMADGHGDEPKSAMVKLYEKVLGITVEREKES